MFVGGLVEMLAVMVPISAFPIRIATRARRSEMNAASTITAKIRPMRMTHVSLPFRPPRPRSVAAAIDVQIHKYNVPKHFGIVV